MPTKMRSYRMTEDALQLLQELKIYNPDLSDAQIIERSLSLAAAITDAWAESKGARQNFRLTSAVDVLAVCRSVEFIT